MSEEGPSTWVTVLLRDANLPQLLLGPAGKAISQLVAGAAEIPASWLAGKADGIKADAEARRQVKKALGEAAASAVVSNPALVDRAVAAYLPEQVRKQANREAVAKAALEHLAREEPNEGSEKEDVDPDWMNVFVRFAEDASSERLRALWGRILAGEIRTSGSTSLSTLRFISELDSDIASKFESVAQRVIQRVYLRKPELKGQEFADLRLLEEVGLLTGLEGHFSQPITFGEDGVHRLWGRKVFLQLTAAPHYEFKIPVILLTRVGREVFHLVDILDDKATLSAFAETIRRPEIKTADFYSMNVVNGMHLRVSRLWGDS